MMGFFSYAKSAIFTEKMPYNIKVGKVVFSYLYPFWVCFLWYFFSCLHCTAAYFLLLFCMVLVRKKCGEKKILEKFRLLLHSAPNIDWTSVWAHFQVVNNAGVLVCAQCSTHMAKKYKKKVKNFLITYFYPHK